MQGNEQPDMVSFCMRDGRDWKKNKSVQQLVNNRSSQADDDDFKVLDTPNPELSSERFQGSNSNGNGANRANSQMPSEELKQALREDEDLVESTERQQAFANVLRDRTESRLVMQEDGLR